MTSPMVLVAEVGDLGAIVSLERATAGAPHWPEAEYAAAIRAMDGVRRCLLVARSAECLVGFAMGRLTIAGEEIFGELESVAVAGAARRSGVGRALCTAVIEWCRGQGARSMELEVRVGSRAAIALYTQMGFATSGRRRGYYAGPVEDALLMEMRLG